MPASVTNIVKVSSFLKFTALKYYIKYSNVLPGNGFGRLSFRMFFAATVHV